MLCFRAVVRRGGSVRSCSTFFRISAEKEEPEGVFHSEQLAQKFFYDIFTSPIL